MKKFKKLTSLFLALTLVALMAALSVGNTSAAVDENGYYVPEEGESTNRYYFAMPNNWRNKFTDTAGVYFFPDVVIDGFVEGEEPMSWPGYKAYFDGYKSYAYSIYYVDCPTDIEFIVWNNYIKSGATDDTAMSDAEKQSDGVNTEFCSLYDYDIYDAEWFAEIEEIYNTDKSALGEYADNFFYDEELDCGFSFRYDNMIYVVNHFSGNPTSGASWNDTYEGDWYFYYGNGEYGTYPTREGAEAHGTLYSLSNWKGMTASPDEPAPTEPKPDMIGDVDGNGVLNISDTTMIQLYLADLTVFSPEQITKADVNRDRVVNVFDVTSIQFLLVGRGIGYWC